MLTKIVCLVILLALLAPLATSTITIQQASITSLEEEEIPTEFGMLTGAIRFKLANFSWPPKEIWLLPVKVDPSEFSKGLKQHSILELPENITFSTCRTAVYLNESLGYGFKIYNTQTTTQILPNGTFCGLAYNGTYYLYASW